MGSAHRTAIDAAGAMSTAVGALLEDAVVDVLANQDFPVEHGRCIRAYSVWGEYAER